MIHFSIWYVILWKSILTIFIEWFLNRKDLHYFEVGILLHQQLVGLTYRDKVTCKVSTKMKAEKTPNFLRFFHVSPN